MASRQHLELLKQGVELWNQWRATNRDIIPDLQGANLEHANLDDVRLSFAQLQGVNFHGAHLQRAYFVRSDLSSANFAAASLYEAHLDRALLSNANLRNAQLTHSRLRLANLMSADLRGTDLSYADLDRAILTNAQLDDADLSYACIGGMSLVNVDLRTVHGLDTVKHEQYSHIGLQTLVRSACQIPEQFLRGAGVPDEFITVACTAHPVATGYATCLIVYAREDYAFAEQLYHDLRKNNILCHSVPLESYSGGADIGKDIVVYDRLLPVISEHMLADQLYHMLYIAEKGALSKEYAEATPVLLRLYLDHTLETRKAAWARLRASRWQHACDFTRWTQEDTYQTSLHQLLHLLIAEVRL